MKNIKSTALPLEEITGKANETESPGQKIKRAIQRNMYQWHRIIGIVTVIPVIFWTFSGVMHPFMAHWFKPAIPHEFIIPKPIQKEQLKVSLQEVLKLNSIADLKNFRIVNFDLSGTFKPVKNENLLSYQLKDNKNGLRYFSAETGKELPDGDKKYAEIVARYFLEDKTSPIKSIEKITSFTDEYRYVNRLLPVWKISFDRPDAMDVYVNTEQSKLGTFNNTQRKAFLFLFNNFHTWDWLDKIANNGVRLSVMIFFLSVIIASTLSGILIYGFMWKSFKKSITGDKVSILKKYHRQIGIAVSFVTLTFATSAIYHAAMKFTPDDRDAFVFEPVFSSVVLEKNTAELNWENAANASLVKIGKENFYQIAYLKTEEKPASVAYFNASTGEKLKDGNLLYAKQLAKKFYLAAQTDNPAACCEMMEAKQEETIGELPEITSTEVISKFTREYGFVNKRLPVVKISYNTPDKRDYYIDTFSGRLAAKITDADRSEGLSFAILHKYFFMDWAGKNIRDITMLVSALGVLVVSLFGLALFIKIRR